MDMVVVISILLFCVFLFLSSLHFYWAFGGRWGSQSVFPKSDDKRPTKNPGKVPTFIVASGLMVCGFFYLIKGGLIAFDLPFWLDQHGFEIIASIFILRAIGEFNYVGFFKKIKYTKFGLNDTKYYSPLCLIIAALTIILALNK